MIRHPYQTTLQEYEHVDEKSMTIPDETYSIQELLTRHVRGMRIDEHMRQGQFDESADFDSLDLEKLRDDDLHEKELVLEELKRQTAQLKNKKNPPTSTKHQNITDVEVEVPPQTPATPSPAEGKSEGEGVKRSGKD